MKQSDNYKATNDVNRVADIVGADPARDLLRVSVEDISDRSGLATDSVLLSELSREIGTWSAGAIPVNSDSPLDVSGATVTVTPDGTLPVEQQSAVAVNSDGPLDVSGATVTVTPDGPLDVSGATVTVTPDAPLDVSAAALDVSSLPDSDESSGQNVTVPASSSTTLATLSGKGSNRLLGQFKSTGASNLDVEWLDSAGGTVIRTENIAEASPGDDWVNIDVPARSPYCNVVLTDTSGAEQTADHTAHMT